jgi:hypothetical protein
MLEPHGFPEHMGSDVWYFTEIPLAKTSEIIKPDISGVGNMSLPQIEHSSHVVI